MAHREDTRMNGCYAETPVSPKRLGGFFGASSGVSNASGGKRHFREKGLHCARTVAPAVDSLQA